MIYGKSSTKAFAVCDPRKEKNESNNNNNNISDNNNNSNNNNGDNNQPLYDIPAHYRRPKSHRGKQRINKYDYSKSNKSAFIGLENSLPNAYTNSTLQFMYNYYYNYNNKSNYNL